MHEDKDAAARLARGTAAPALALHEDGWSGCAIAAALGVTSGAPRGEMPVLHAPLRRDHLAVIRGVTASGRLLVQVREQPLCGPALVAFLRQLVRQIPGKLLVIWDGAPIQRAQQVKDVFATEPGARVWLEVNPDAGVWQHLKRVEMRNLVCKDPPDLKQQLRFAIARLRHTRQVLRGCFTHCGDTV